MTDDKKVIIAGAGPVGLCLALALAKASVPVLLLEQDTALAKEQRGAAFHPPTMEMLAALGLKDRLFELGIQIPVWQMRDREDGLIAEFDLRLLADETAFPFRFHLPQHFLASILLDELRKFAHVDIRFGARISDVADVGSSALVRYEASGAAKEKNETAARWVVGTDGAHSCVRKKAGVAFEGFTWPEKFLVTNVDYPIEEFGYSGTAYVADPDRWAVVLKLADPHLNNLWRIAMPADPALEDDALLEARAVQQRLREVLRVEHDLPLVYSGTYRVHQRVAATFRTGRVLLAGDAAHINNPLGGFGLNGGIHDAINLAEKLAAVWHGYAEESLLDLYSRQRRTVAVEVVQANSIRNKKAMEERDIEMRKRNQDELRAIAADSERAKAFLLNSSMLSSLRRAAQVR
jgi:3-(3-hydroxy-phenyl)propionate hydroxylase